MSFTERVCDLVCKAFALDPQAAHWSIEWTRRDDMRWRYNDREVESVSDLGLVLYEEIRGTGTAKRYKGSLWPSLMAGYAFEFDRPIDKWQMEWGWKYAVIIPTLDLAQLTAFREWLLELFTYPDNLDRYDLGEFSRLEFFEWINTLIAERAGLGNPIGQAIELSESLIHPDPVEDDPVGFTQGVAELIREAFELDPQYTDISKEFSYEEERYVFQSLYGIDSIRDFGDALIDMMRDSNFSCNRDYLENCLIGAYATEFRETVWGYSRIDGSYKSKGRELLPIIKSLNLEQLRAFREWLSELCTFSDGTDSYGATELGNLDVLEWVEGLIADKSNSVRVTEQGEGEA